MPGVYVRGQATPRSCCRSQQCQQQSLIRGQALKLCASAGHRQETSEQTAALPERSKRSGLMDATTEKTLKQLEDMTEGMLRTLEQVDQIAQDFSRADGGRQQRELFSKVESVASALEELHEVPIAPELTVPFAVLEHIDKGQNPDLYWKQVVDTTVEVRLCTCQ